MLVTCQIYFCQRFHYIHIHPLHPRPFHFKDECGEAAGEKKRKNEKFPFIFQVILQTKILESVNAVSTMLQATNTDMQKALTLLDNTIQSLSEYRGAFDQAKVKARTFAEKWGSQPTFENVRVKRMKCHYH